MTLTAETPTDDAQLALITDHLFGAALGAAELSIIHLGRELGIYDALRADGPATAADVAARTGVDARYAREWLEHQAVVGVLAVDDATAAPDARRYSLPDPHATALLDEEHPAYVGAFADIAPILARSLGLVTDAFRTGSGVPFAAYGLHDMQAGFTRPMFANSLVGEWLPAVPDVHARLAGGESLRVADFGCGEGWAAIYLAEAFPRITVDGFDLDDTSIAAARRHAAARGVADRVRFEVRDVADPAFEARYDFVYACEFIHDLPDPVGALHTMRRVTEGGGAVLVIDENSDEEFVPSGDPVQRLLYAFSILHCLPAGRDAEHSAATGTVMRPDTFRTYALSAGFGSVETLPIEHDFFRFYRPRA